MTVEPYARDGAGAESPLSQDPAAPTVFLNGAGETILWWVWSDIADNNIPDTQWHVRDSGGTVTDFPPWWGWTRFFCQPEISLDKGDFEFWVTATDTDGTAESQHYSIRVAFPPLLPVKYHPAIREFRGTLARVERTAFDFGALANGIVDSPEVDGCDNPSMFFGNGRLHFIFGDPNIYTGDPASPRGGLNGALAFTDDVVPEKGIDLAHRRNWVSDPTTGTAKSIIEGRPGISRVNNTGGAILPHGDGHRIWFALYDYGSGPRPSYQNYYRVAIAWSDDGLETPAVRDDNLILWDKDDPGNGPNNPDPYLGYSMRLFKGHLYMMIPREGGSSPVLIRCRVEDLDNRSLNDWHYLVSVDGDGVATWSSAGITRGQISWTDFPTVDFGASPAGIVTSTIWNPRLNRWIAFPAYGNALWEARQLWGPYRRLVSNRYFRSPQFGQSYAPFGHDLLLGGNGEWMYHAEARSWQPLGLYGTYFQRLRLAGRMDLAVEPKSGVAGDAITITCVNAGGLGAAPPDKVAVTVDGNPATFVSQDGDLYSFRYEMTGAENGGEVGVVDVAASMQVPIDAESSYLFERDAVLVVNHRNELATAVTSPPTGATVTGWVAIDVTAAHEKGPEVLAENQPDVRVLKTELQNADIGGVVTTDLEPPYRLWLDATRYGNGPQTFRVVACDTLDRCGEATLALNIRNPVPPAPLGNLVRDGNMEEPGLDAWQPVNGARLSKIDSELHRSGRRSLRLESDTPGSWAGFQQAVTGLQGGERLRLTAWSKLESNYTASLRWYVTDASGAVVTSQYISSYGWFRRLLFEFDNPPGNASLRIQCIVRDTGDEGIVAGEPVTRVAAIVDDIVLRPACYPVVEPPDGVTTEIAPAGDAVVVSWEPAPDVNVQFYGVYRKPVSQGQAAWEKIAEVREHERSYTDDNLPGPPADYEYRMVSIDEMGWESAQGQPDLAPSLLRLDSDACPGGASLAVRVGNFGGAVAAAPIPVAFYDGDPGAGGGLLGVARTSADLAPGGVEDVSLPLTPAPFGLRRICARAGDDGTGGLVAGECSEANNVQCRDLVFCNGAPVADAGGPRAADCNGSLASLQLDGSGSLDPEGGALTYEWITDCPGARFDDPAGPAPWLALDCGPPCPLQCSVTLVVTDPDGGQDTDTASVTVAVAPLAELSDVTAGEPPLRVRAGTRSSLLVEKDLAATAYNVYAARLGSWNAPTAVTGSVCGLTTWTDNADGTITLDHVMPADSWVVVTASNPCHEGAAGSGSDGVERSGAGSWTSCGPSP